ncbi:N-acetyltransferase family protein [Streptosporangium sp. CA-115845]|uniref:GNAT family N-acetyltransferase n=1 Tax=Streptosporangium sp. CA-115845 TaxID=3240071 RepID=UPI003D8FDD70
MIRPATPDDIPTIIDMIHGLAEYEKAPDQVKNTPDLLREALFRPSPSVFCHMATDGDRATGFAIWFVSYSTWTGTHGVYLEDLFVRPEHRRGGYGRELLTELARICVERGYDRFEWSVLDWNAPAIDFYRSLGAEPQDEWDRYRLAGPALEKLAATERKL